jgi:trehalose 6-phosphate synthase
MSDADRAVAQEGGPAESAMPAELAYLTPRLVYVPEQTYGRYYDDISNRLLWFAHHNLSQQEPDDELRLRASWHDGYVAANQALADAVIAELELHGTDAPVMFHDYHLYLAPAMVRQRVPEARTQHFVHVPWPGPGEWAGVPEQMVRAIYTGLAANDVIGFQTPRDARNFLAGARRYLPGAYVSHDPDELWQEGHRALVRAYPIALTPAAVRASAQRPEAVAQARELRHQLKLDEGRQLIVRVDRIEPAKNIVRGFEAYERMLADHPELHERVTFLALLVPSRESVPEYQEYAARVRQAVERINVTYGNHRWDPIVAIYGNDRARALACMRDYDVLLVNSLADGMNLVVKEGGLVNTRDGVIVLSERAGAYVQLRNEVIGIAPLEVEGTSRALYQALTLPQEERRRRARGVRAILEREDASSWLGRQLADLMRVSGVPEDVSDDKADDEAETLAGPAGVAAAFTHAEPVLMPHRVPGTDVRVAVPQTLPRGNTSAQGFAGTSGAPMRHVHGPVLPLPRPRGVAQPGTGTPYSGQEPEPPELSDLD